MTPVEGLLAGIAGALLMLPVMSVLHRFSGPSGRDLLVQISHATAGRGAAGGYGITLTAAAAHALVGALLGLLYAVSQDRAPARAMVTVGLFYGLVIWVVSRIVVPWLFGPSFRTILHSYVWLVACLVYGAVLGASAILGDRRRPRAARIVPVD